METRQEDGRVGFGDVLLDIHASGDSSRVVLILSPDDHKLIFYLHQIDNNYSASNLGSYNVDPLADLFLGVRLLTIQPFHGFAMLTD